MDTALARVKVAWASLSVVEVVVSVAKVGTTSTLVSLTSPAAGLMYATFFWSLPRTASALIVAVTVIGAPG